MNAEPAVPRHLSQSSEVPSLVNWSPRWIQSTSAVSLLIAVEASASAARNYFGNFGLLNVALECWVASSFLATALIGFRVFQKSKRYVETEQEAFLGEMMASLATLWSGLALGMLALANAVVVQFSGKHFKALFFSLPPVATLALVIAVLAFPLALTLSFLKAEQKAPYAGEKFSAFLQVFGARSLIRLRLLSVFSIAGGVASVALWLIFSPKDFAYSFVGCLLAGVAMAGLGGMAQWYRRSVRDIERNPTPIFFERTLNRLNVFWLVLPFLLATVWIAGLFRMVI